jgi:hypothetical protein
MRGISGIGDVCFFSATIGKQSYGRNQNPLVFDATKNVPELGTDYGTYLGTSVLLLTEVSF